MSIGAHIAALEVTRRLAATPDWNSFRIGLAETATCEVAAGDVSQQRAEELLAALAPALARGMQLLAEQQLDVRTLEQHQDGMMALGMLMLLWQAHARTLATSPADERALVQLAVQMTRAGTITAFTQLAKALTRLISSPEAQQQQQQHHQWGVAAEAAAGQLRAAPELVAALLFVFSDVAGIWPGGMRTLSNPAMAAAADAVAELAVAVLRNKNAHWLTSPTSSSSGSGGSSNSSGGGGSNTADAAAALAVKLSRLPEHIAGSSSSFMLLQMCCLALTAQALHQQQHGLLPAAAGCSEPATATGASEEQQQWLAVPAYHLQLQQALGLPEGLTIKESALKAAWIMELTLVRFHDRLSSGSSSNSSSSSNSTGLQQPAAAAVDAALLAPLLLVMLECCLLQPEYGIVHACIAVVLQLLEGCVGLDCVPESLAGDLPATLLQLVPVIRRLDAAPPAAGTVAAATLAASGRGTIAEDAGLALVALVMCVTKSAILHYDDVWTTDRRFQALLAAFLQHLERHSALLEAAVRGRDKWRMGVPLFLQADVLLKPATVHACTPGTSVVLSAAAQQQVFSLLISCLKAGAAAAGTGPWEAASVLFKSADVAIHPAPLLVLSNSNSSLTLAVHLLGRAMVSAARGLQRLASSGSGSSSGTFGQQEAKDALITVQQGLQLLVSQLPQLSPALPGPVLQQLLDQQAALQQQAGALQAQLPEVAAAASVGEQLEAFWAAVVAQVPVKHCCNNHGCTNSSRDSEQELASGKGCVCSGCLAARYCSRECQVAHYKHWHKAVCKRLQQQRQEQQS